MAFPTVAINSATGSDTLASGAGPATALSGTLAATHATTTVNITDAVNLAGVAVDGSAALWVATSAGRRWSAITAITGSSGAWVVTVADAYGVTDAADAWAIGGKRASLGGSVQLGLDMRAGWTIDVQTGETLTANFRLTPNSSAGLTSRFLSTTTTRDSKGTVTAPIITTSTNSVCGLDIGGANNLSVQGIGFTSTAVTPGDGIGTITNAATNDVTFQGCLVSGFRDGVIDADAGQNTTWKGMILEAVEVKNCTQRGIFINTGSNCKLLNCWVHGNNTSNGGYTGLSVGQQITAIECIFDSNTRSNASVNLSTSYPQVFRNCVFSNAIVGSGAGDGLIITDAGIASFELQNCIFYNNPGTGIKNNQAPAGMCGIIVRNNAYGSNGTNYTAGFPAGANDVTLTANPFNSSSDFGLNSTAGGGVVCKGAAAARIGSANAAGDIGAIPSGGGSGGGGGGISHIIGG
jgi:hypothetical protein